MDIFLQLMVYLLPCDILELKFFNIIGFVTPSLDYYLAVCDGNFWCKVSLLFSS